MIAFDGCVPAFLEIDQRPEMESATFACAGPAPFDNDTAPCCDEHEEEWTRNRAADACLTTVDARKLANAVGVAYEDMRRFLEGVASLTWPSRKLIRVVLR